MKIVKFRVLPEWILERWIIVAYLVINGGGNGVAKLIEIKPESRFYKVLAENLDAYIHDGVMPPDDIAPAILNLADDYLAGNQMNLRAGDYISIQKHLRSKK